MEIENSPWRWLLPAVLVGLVLGGVLLSIVSYATAEDSLIFDRSDQAVFGAFAGSIGGAIAGLVLWTLVVLLRALVRVASRAR